jgi:DHA1 family bicyclomycin/chloramphenicol resistance-like MFS transporter
MLKTHFKKKLPLVVLIIISLLGCCMELDISIPSFPSMMRFFSASEAQVQNTLSLNFLAFCLSGLIYGPLSEAWGRRGLMLFGATCFLIGAIGCVFSFSIYQLMFWRFFQGLGASSTLVLGFVMISDRYSGEEAANQIGKINAYITIFMASAPILGSLIIHFFTWRANFTAIAIIAFISWFFLILQLPETKLEKKSIQFFQIIKDYSSLVKHKKFMLLSAIPNLLVTAYLTFVGSAAFYYINTSQLSYFEYAVHQGLVVMSFSLMSFYADKVVKKIGGEKAVQFGMCASGMGTALLIGFSFFFPFEPVLVTSAMCLFAIGCAFPMSVTFAESLEVVPHLKGVGSSFIMSSRLFISSVAVALTGVFFDGSMLPVAIVNGVAVSFALLLYFKVEKKQEALRLI